MTHIYGSMTNRKADVAIISKKISGSVLLDHYNLNDITMKLAIIKRRPLPGKYDIFSFRVSNLNNFVEILEEIEKRVSQCLGLNE